MRYLARYLANSLCSFLIVASVLGLTLVCPPAAKGIPPLARKYGLPCSACHEAWPKLNSFGQSFRDNGYQLNNERDAPIYQNPSYVPIGMRTFASWHFESSNHVVHEVTPGDPASGLTGSVVHTSGFDISGVDILTAGTLAKNISFLLVPSIDTDGTIGLESIWARLDNVLGSRWVNVKLGKMELDLPLSEKRMLTLSDVGGEYQLYDFTPAGDTNEFSFGENQVGIELMGHSRDSHTRYAVSLLSSTNGAPGFASGRSYDGYLHVSQAFLLPKLGLQRVGAYGYLGEAPTSFLTNGGAAIPGTGRQAKSFYRAGAYASAYVGKLDVTGGFQHSQDSAYFGSGAASPVGEGFTGPGVLPPGACYAIGQEGRGRPV